MIDMVEMIPQNGGPFKAFAPSSPVCRERWHGDLLDGDRVVASDLTLDAQVQHPRPAGVDKLQIGHQEFYDPGFRGDVEATARVNAPWELWGRELTFQLYGGSGRTTVRLVWWDAGIGTFWVDGVPIAAK